MTSGEVRLMNLSESVRAQRLERFFTWNVLELQYQNTVMSTSGGWDRTSDTRLMKPLLYPLSYAANAF